MESGLWVCVVATCGFIGLRFEIVGYNFEYLLLEFDSKSIENWPKLFRNRSKSTKNDIQLCENDSSALSAPNRAQVGSRETSRLGIASYTNSSSRGVVGGWAKLA